MAGAVAARALNIYYEKLRGMSMHKGFATTVIVFLINICSSIAPVQAMRMDFETEWRCTTAHVTVDGTTYPAGTYCTSFIVTSGGSNYPTGNDLQYWDTAFAGGGAFRYRVQTKIPDYPLNNEPAICSSDEMTRWLHATKDVNAENLNRVASNQGWLPIGALVRVTYDDGSSEVWIVNAQYTQTAIAMAPLGGSLKCGD